MKTVYQYVCEKCNGIYNTKEQCELCERKHSTPVSMEVRGGGYKVNNTYPFLIYIKMDDGEVIPFYSK